MGYVLGIDLGTGSLKGLVLNKQGHLVGTASCDYDLIQEKSGFSEQNPQDWINACKTVLLELKNTISDFSEHLEGISFSGQMHSLVVLDEHNKPLRNAILWNDTRTTEQCKMIMDGYSQPLIDITSNVALEGFTLPKIMWIQQYEPDIWDKVAHILLPKDYLGFWMTGQQHMDYSDAAGTLLLDMKTKQWSDEILIQFNIKKSTLPALIDSTGCTGTLTKELRDLIGCKKTVKVFAGGADNACAALGAGILSNDTALASIGTSGVFLSYEKENHTLYNGKLHLFNHVVKDCYYSMGVTLAAGHSLNWFKKTFAPHDDFRTLLKEIKEVEPGSNGLLFTPYIVGERTPYTDSTIRGSFIGIDTNHTLKHFTRAVLEGITFSLKDSQQLMEKMSGKVFHKIISVGGGAKNTDWLQMQADIFNADILRLESEQGPGLGAAMLAAMGLCWFDDIQSCADVFVRYKELIKPTPKNVEKYKVVYNIYKKMYGATKDICQELSTI